MAGNRLRPSASYRQEVWLCHGMVQGSVSQSLRPHLRSLVQLLKKLQHCPVRAMQVWGTNILFTLLCLLAVCKLSAVVSTLLSC